MELYLIPLEDYNQSTGQTLTLDPDEILVYQNRNTYGQSTLTLAGRTFQVAQELSEFLDNGFSTAEIITSLFIVTPDFNTLESLRTSVNDFYDDGGSVTVKGYYCFDTGAGKDQQIQLYGAIRESVRYREEADISLESRAYEEQDFFSLFGGSVLPGHFPGLPVPSGHGSHHLLQSRSPRAMKTRPGSAPYSQVGMSKAEVRKTIHSQILTVFFLPLLGAGVHTMFAFPILSKMLLLFGLTNRPLLMLTTGITFLLFCLIYSIIYLLTSRFYYRIVTPEK